MDRWHRRRLHAASAAGANRRRLGIVTLHEQRSPQEHCHCRRRHCGLDEAGRQLLRQAMDELGLSARAHDRILRVARTIADLEGGAAIRSEHVVEAIGYRSLDRKLWMR